MSSHAAVRVENLSKVYRVDVSNSARKGATGWFDTLVRNPLHKLRHGATHGMHTEEFFALDDINFELAEGEVLGIVGRNGAGKSTLLKILSRITEPTRGKAEIIGRVGSLLEVGTGFHNELTGRENVFLNASILGMSRREIQRRYDSIVEFSGVERFMDTPVKRYSSGMRVRLAFAVAAHIDPEVMIVDEVLAVGDAEFQKKAVGKMKAVSQGEGRTVLFVSHNMASIQNLCTQTMIMDKGRLDYIGITSEA
ncbi:MAG: ABC transporter ATP-binding protein, partial [Planctomycetales bacterium]|nr:ABC transporter ATP-binding protein [Planctomycetales bacterium]